MHPKIITIDNERYIRESDVPPINLGEKRIIVADRGWVFVGDCTDEDDGSVTIRNAKNIRRWGTSSGLGELVNGPLENTKVDDYGTVRCTPIVSIGVAHGW